VLSLAGRVIAQVVFFLFRWRPEGSVPEVPRLIAIAAPHTSAWDMVFMLSYIWYHRISVVWLGKEALFQNIFVGWFFRKTGGIPVDRSGEGHQVERLAAIVRDAERIRLCLAPSGSRGRGDYWRSGFYHLALQAEVPVLLAYVDYNRRRIGVGPLLRLSGEVERDMNEIRRFYFGIEGKYPDLETPVRVREEETVPRKKGPREKGHPGEE